MNRSILFGILSIAGVVALVGGVTFALFSSQASNNGNTFGAGTLVLNIMGYGDGASLPVFTFSGIAPGQFRDQKITLTNTGSVDASSIQVTKIDLGSNTALADKLTLMLFYDQNDDGIFNGSDVSLGTGHLSDSSWTGYTLPGVTLPHSGIYHLGARITFDSDADNSYQGLTLTFNLNFQANQ